MSNDFNQEIIDHALHSRENLSLAIRVAKAFDDIRKYLIKSFAELLLVRLQNELPSNKGWEIYVDTLINNPLTQYSGLFIKNKNWAGDLRIGIDAQSSYARSIIFVIYENELKKLSGEKRNEIKNKLENIRGKSRSGGPNTIWYRLAESNLTHWDNEIALLKLQNGEAADYFTKELVDIAKLVDSIFNNQPIACPDTQDMTNISSIETNPLITSESE